jgi:hypothetical protein
MPEPKRRRVQLAKSELLLHLAMTAERWSRECESTQPGVIPFDQWPDDDPLVTLCRTYQLSPADMARACRQIAEETEGRAMRAGYEDHYDAVSA